MTFPRNPLRRLPMGAPAALSFRRALAAAVPALAMALFGCGESGEPAVAPGATTASGVESPPPELDPFPGPPDPPRGDYELPVVRDLPRRYRELHAMLASDEVLMEWKHEIVVDDLAPDPSPSATDVLILASVNESIPVSMAGLKVLAERGPDGDVEMHLVWLLDDERWERRAWAARVLGTLGSDEAVAALRARMERESEDRVRRQLEGAIESLRSQTAGHRPAAGEAGG